MRKKILKTAYKGKYLDHPSSAKNFIPEWYKKSEQFIGGKVEVFPQSGINRGPKLCVPFLDALTSGYIATLWQDIIVSHEFGEPVIRWEEFHDSPKPAQDRNPITSPTFPIPAGHFNKHFVWQSPYIFKVPKGYSLIVTHPFNRFELPFTTLSAVVDADGVMAAGNIPFYLKDGFEGVIEKGTPLFQVFPFKREDWKTEEDMSLIENSNRNISMSSRVVRGWYKNNQWSKKTYE